MVEPSIPIDLAEIPTIRFQQFVGDFPLPPPGHIQVGYLPGSGMVARFPNGDYAGLSGIAPAGPQGPTGATGPSGPAGPQGPTGPTGSGGSVISGTGGVVETINDPFNTGGVTISPASGRAIRLNGAVTDALNQPQAPDAVTLVQQAAAPEMPATGRQVFWADTNGAIRTLDPAAGDTITLGDAGVSAAQVAAGQVQLFVPPDAAVIVQTGSAILLWGGNLIGANSSGLLFALDSGTARVTGLPTTNPGVAGALWIAPVTRQLMVSAG